MSERPRRESQGSLGIRTRVSIVFIGAGVLALLLLGAITLSYVHARKARSRLVSRVDPATIEAGQLLAAYLNQETGIRGYALTSEARFLEPYDDGTTQARTLTASLHSTIGDDPELRPLLDDVTARADAWEAGFVRPALDRLRRPDPAQPITAADLDRSKQLFDALRASLNRLDAQLAAQRTADSKSLAAGSGQLVAVLSVGFASLLLAGYLAWRSLRSWIVDPISSLAADARQVADGDLTHPIAPVGPAELAGLADDTEAMRRRIVGELETVASARAELSELNADLIRSNIELEQFAYVASHDLQEPLRKVVSFCQLLEQRYGGQLDERADQYIGFAVDGARRMQTLINDLLAFSRVGRNTEGFAPVDLGATARAALDDLSEAVAEVHAEVVVGQLPTVSGDPGLLRALFQNLIGNALKFHSSDALRVEVTSRPVGDRWELAVTDNGIGIEPRFADRIFVIFQRLHGKDSYEGNGIGLALCKKIVEFHGGQIWLDTGHSPGTSFVFSLPNDPHPPLPDDIRARLIDDLSGAPTP